MYLRVLIFSNCLRSIRFTQAASSVTKIRQPSHQSTMLMHFISFILLTNVSAFSVINLNSLKIRRTTKLPATNPLCKTTTCHIHRPNLEEPVLDMGIQEDPLTESWQEEEDDIWIKEAFEVGHESMLLPKNTFQIKDVIPDSPVDSRPFPLGMIVDQQAIKKALLISAVNQRIGGVIISGRRGSGKSVLARAIHRLLPPHILRVKGSYYNIDPSGSEMLDSFLQHNLLTSGMSLNDLDTEKVPTPFVQIPLNVMEDSLLGTVDIEKSMETGHTVFSPGLLAKAHRGVLYVDEINLLDEETANILLNVIADGFVKVEREGLSVTYPCKPLLVATYNPEEGEIREHLLDRIGVALSTDAHLFSVNERVKVVENVVGFSAGTKEQFSAEAAAELKQAENEEVQIRSSIAEARSILPKVEIDSSQILYICEEATRAGCEGQRAEIFATEIAKANAALDGRTKTNADDLQTGVILAMASRGSFIPTEVSDDEDTSSTTASSQPASSLEPLPPSPDLDTSEEDKSEKEEQDESEEDLEPESESEDTTEEENLELEIPLEFMFGVDMMPIDPKLMYFNKWARKGKGGKRSRIFNLQRGRYVKPIFPKGKQGKIAVAATLRAAAPYQIPRRKRAIGTRKEGRLVIIDKDDFRIKRMSRKAGSLIIFVVDASGSMALNRMDAAKGAAMSLLSEAYKSRDKICLVEFHSDKAQVLVPPTKSMALTKNRLVSMPCGGGSPLAHGLMLAMRTGLNAIKVKQDVGRVIIVLLTDGRANIPVCTSMGERFDPIVDPESKDDLPSRKYLKDEVLACAKQLGSLPDFSLLCIDTEDQFVGTGLARDIARAASGNYYHILDTDASAVSRITKRGLENAKTINAV